VSAHASNQAQSYLADVLFAVVLIQALVSTAERMHSLIKFIAALVGEPIRQRTHDF